jgi:hypothetical protein
MDQEIESQFNEFEKPPVIRRKLLPWWIKTFCWIFMLLGICAVGSLIGNLFMSNIDLSIYGFSSNNAYTGTGLSLLQLQHLKVLLLILFGLKNQMPSQLVKSMPFAES